MSTESNESTEIVEGNTFAWINTGHQLFGFVTLCGLRRNSKDCSDCTWGAKAFKFVQLLPMEICSNWRGRSDGMHCSSSEISNAELEGGNVRWVMFGLCAIKSLKNLVILAGIGVLGMCSTSLRKLGTSNFKK